MTPQWTFCRLLLCEQEGFCLHWAPSDHDGRIIEYKPSQHSLFSQNKRCFKAINCLWKTNMNCVMMGLNEKHTMNVTLGPRFIFKSVQITLKSLTWHIIGGVPGWNKMNLPVACTCKIFFLNFIFSRAYFFVKIYEREYNKWTLQILN